MGPAALVVSCTLRPALSLRLQAFAMQKVVTSRYSPWTSSDLSYVDMYTAAPGICTRVCRLTVRFCTTVNTLKKELLQSVNTSYSWEFCSPSKQDNNIGRCFFLSRDACARAKVFFFLFSYRAGLCTFNAAVINRPFLFPALLLLPRNRRYCLPLCEANN